MRAHLEPIEHVIGGIPNTRNRLPEYYYVMRYFEDSTKQANDEGVVGGYSEVKVASTISAESTKAAASINEANKTYLHSREMDGTAVANGSSSGRGDFSKDESQNFEDFVVGHFISRAHDILVACNACVEGASCYSKDMESYHYSREWHQYSLAEQMKKLVREFARIGAKDCKKFLSGISRFFET